MKQASFLLLYWRSNTYKIYSYDNDGVMSNEIHTISELLEEIFALRLTNSVK